MITYKIIRAESKRACEGDLGYRTGRDKKRRFMRLFFMYSDGRRGKKRLLNRNAAMSETIIRQKMTNNEKYIVSRNKNLYLKIKL